MGTYERTYVVKCGRVRRGKTIIWFMGFAFLLAFRIYYLVPIIPTDRYVSKM